MVTNKIKKYREKRKQTIADLAEKSGLSKSYISLLENGYRKNPSQEAMQKIAECLGKSVQAVFFPRE